MLCFHLPHLVCVDHVLLYLICNLSMGYHQRQAALKKRFKPTDNLCMGTQSQCFLIRWSYYNCVCVYLNVVCIAAAPEGKRWDSEAAALPANTARMGSHITNSSPKFHPNKYFYSDILVLPGEWLGRECPKPSVLKKQPNLVRGSYVTEGSMLSSSPAMGLQERGTWDKGLE